VADKPTVTNTVQSRNAVELGQSGGGVGLRQLERPPYQAMLFCGTLAERFEPVPAVGLASNGSSTASRAEDRRAAGCIAETTLAGPMPARLRQILATLHSLPR